jgi:hypothetical protein
MSRFPRTALHARTLVIAGLCLTLGSCTPRYDQDYDAFRQGQSTVGRSSSTLPRSDTTLPGSPTTLPRRGAGTTTLPLDNTTLPRSGR